MRGKRFVTTVGALTLLVGTSGLVARAAEPDLKTVCRALQARQDKVASFEYRWDESQFVPEGAYDKITPMRIEAELDGHPCVVAEHLWWDGESRELMWLAQDMDYALLRVQGFSSTEQEVPNWQADLDWVEHEELGWVLDSWDIDIRMIGDHVQATTSKIVINAQMVK